ncbi:UNVERIFIED_CONTAM: hypothetical protein Sangu_0039600 [Sesamum angustifolium]|uniref:UBC core domain-containing protein n=1 Tax=Sesamum angustifolium TaxID=2727405 RepID=A0AAW2RI41_9LAMI
MMPSELVLIGRSIVRLRPPWSFILRSGQCQDQLFGFVRLPEHYNQPTKLVVKLLEIFSEVPKSQHDGVCFRGLHLSSGNL